MIGDYRPVSSKYIRVGDVIYPKKATAPHSVIKRLARPQKGPLLLLEEEGSRQRKQFSCGKEEKIMRLHIPAQSTGPAKDWLMGRGDVVVYPQEPVSRTTAAIRHNGGGWYSTSGVRTPLTDLKIITDVVEGRSVVVRRSYISRVGLQLNEPYRLGAVIAGGDPSVMDPTVWVRTHRDLWKSSTGTEASDAMITFEMNRKTYQPLWIPGR